MDPASYSLTLRIMPTPESLAESAATALIEAGESALQLRDRFSLALSGGSSPRILFELLGTGSYQSWEGWQRTHIFWSDERAVEPGDPDSNYYLAKETLLDHIAVPAEQIHRLRGEAENLELEARRYEAILDNWRDGGKTPRLDFLLLGLGADGHTASLFPGSPVLSERDAWVSSAPGPPPHPMRLTFTFPILNAGRLVAFFATGSGKSEAVARVLEGTEGVQMMPAAGVRPVQGQVIWFLDEKATTKLGTIRPTTREEKKN